MGPEILLVVVLIAIADKWGDDPVTETIVLLSDDDGGIGKLAIDPGDNELVLDAAGQAALVGKETRTVTLDDGDINTLFGDAISARPQPATSYILYFQEGSTILEAGSETVLADIFADLDKRAAPDITIIGHTDRVGSIDANDRLALSRAKAVLGWMADKGVDRDLMDAAGRGEREPLIATEDGVDEARNRRVEISIR